MSWKYGPMHKNTYGWGGVVLETQHGAARDPDTPGAFYFASFEGDHVRVYDNNNGSERVVSGYEVRYYNNALGLAPDWEPARAEATA